MQHMRDLTKPYKVLPNNGIVYSTCRDFNHISRYRDLRQVVLDSGTPYRKTILETTNPFVTHLDVTYHEVTINEENRLDLIADTELGSATYGWVLAYFNHIADGYSAIEGQKLIVPEQGVTALLNNGEILAPIPYTKLNLGEE